MTKEFEFLMKLAAAGAKGEPLACSDDSIDWEILFRLANEQSLMPLAAYGLKLSCLQSCPEEICRKAIDGMRSAAVNNCMRRSAVVRLLHSFDLAEIHAVLIKGYSIADCYAAPECRVSADTDILVNPKDEQRACDLLSTLGFKIEPRWKNGHHAVCHHPSIGCVELHVLLYDFSHYRMNSRRVHAATTKIVHTKYRIVH